MHQVQARLRRPTRLLAGVLAVTGWLSSAAAQDETHACSQASEQGLTEKHASHLVAARAQLLVCARDVCPKVLREDCAQQLAAVDGALPSVVLGATDAAGKDLFDVRVSVDGLPATTHLDGKAIPLDPGKHALHFEADGLVPHDEDIVAREGEKNRVVTVHMAPPGDAPASSSHTPATTTSALATTASPQAPAPSPGPPVLAYVVGGLGVVALGVGTYFEVDQAQRYSHLNSTCAPAHTCQQSDVDAVNNERVIGGVLLGVGGAAVALAVVLLVTRHTNAPARTGLLWGVAPTERGAALGVRGTF
jgi:hypothetical protein